VDFSAAAHDDGVMGLQHNLDRAAKLDKYAELNSISVTY
jgi:hypothetical protein